LQAALSEAIISQAAILGRKHLRSERTKFLTDIRKQFIRKNARASRIVPHDSSKLGDTSSHSGNYDSTDDGGRLEEELEGNNLSLKVMTSFKTHFSDLKTRLKFVDKLFADERLGYDIHDSKEDRMKKKEAKINNKSWFKRSRHKMYKLSRGFSKGFLETEEKKTTNEAMQIQVNRKRAYSTSEMEVFDASHCSFATSGNFSFGGDSSKDNGFQSSHAASLISHTPRHFAKSTAGANSRQLQEALLQVPVTKRGTDSEAEEDEAERELEEQNEIKLKRGRRLRSLSYPSETTEMYIRYVMSQAII
jgi:hypothetical protein